MRNGVEQVGVINNLYNSLIFFYLKILGFLYFKDTQSKLIRIEGVLENIRCYYEVALIDSRAFAWEAQVKVLTRKLGV
jgi:hypothetical protein